MTDRDMNAVIRAVDEELGKPQEGEVIAPKFLARRPDTRLGASAYAPPRHREVVAAPEPPPPLSAEAADLIGKMNLDHVHKLVEVVGAPYKERLDKATADWEAFGRWSKTTIENAEKAAREGVEQLLADRQLAADSEAALERARRPFKPSAS
jgi:hypothetical protein